MKTVKTPQADCKAAVVRCDITPEVGIYHRMWGAALHDKATGVHRPLLATMLWLEEQQGENNDPIVMVSLDHCILDRQEIDSIRRAIELSSGVPKENVLVTLTHTHGAGWMSRSRSDLPGGELLGPYLDRLIVQMGELSKQAKEQVVDAAIVYGTGKCDLATHRNYFDEELQSFVCGLNPEGFSDDTLMLSKISTRDGKTLATIVNYACHPTTLAWDNTLISPDWIGAMREVIEENQGGLCLFLQGASGDLGPREGFVGQTEIADRNGRQVGYAVLSALESFPMPLTEYRYSGAVISGTRIGTWRHEPIPHTETNSLRFWVWDSFIVELPYRHDLPTIEQTTHERQDWIQREQQARLENNEAQVREARAQVEQRTRQLTRLNHLIPGNFYPLQVQIGILGDGIWVFLPGELYQIFQTTLRARFATHPMFVTTLTNDWQPGYIPAASSYGYQIYQEVIAATAPGCLEILIETISRRIHKLLEHRN